MCPQTAQAQSESPNSASSSSSSSSDSTDSSSPPEDRSSIVAADKRQNPPFSRRGHVKSRLGCFSCKRRRVKCNELRPCCSNCRRLGLRCEYPSQAPGTSAASRPATSAPQPQAPLTTLALEDLRFYHQFLTVAYPTLPFKEDWVWSQCAAMSHQYDYLAHALLGLGASHVSQNNPGLDYTPSALQHRVTAIERVNEEFRNPGRTSQEADALLATLVCLVSQSSLLPNTDSMVEYLTMTRGVNLVSSQLVPDFEQSIFRVFTLERHVESLTGMVSEQPRDFKLMEEYRKSALALRPLCAGTHEQTYLDGLIKAIDEAHNSALESWKEFVKVWMTPTTFSNQDFSAFISPENHGARLLIVHGFLLDYVLGQFCIEPDQGPKCSGRKNVIISWTRNVAEELPATLKSYADWPLSYCDVLENKDCRYLLSP